jgi:hypothetical protein
MSASGSVCCAKMDLTQSVSVCVQVTVPSDVVENGSVVFNSTKLIETLGNVIANTPPALGD